ncbi:MAG: hypothetical protein HY908_31290 [Myxococcales bacterium]|nr:hypothetical protein [Myxococcales bacterium]
MHVFRLAALAAAALGTLFVVAPLACSAAAHGPGTTTTGAGGLGVGGSGGSTGASGGAAPTSEQCDQIDNNGNALVDEGCACSDGASQGCWSGPPTRRGVGICRDGVQLCAVFGEFTSWGPCQGEVLPAAEISGNGIDEDCDGSDPGGGCNPVAEDCGNAADDDCDGLVDCADPACAATCPECAPSETLCADALDDDCDGFVDCVDPDCAASTDCDVPPPPPGCVPEFPFFLEIWCGDGKDNDCDSAADCADSDCHTPGQCGCAQEESSCHDSVDEDCDGDIDCADRHCQVCAPGSFRWCDDPTYCHWGKQECGPDGHWGTCYEVLDAPPGCNGVMYNAQCCVQAGECCQNYPVDEASIGDCVGIVTCP